VLKPVARFDLNAIATAKGVDLFKTLCVYNFGFWFDGREAKVTLNLEPPAVALVTVEGEARIYAPFGSDPSQLEERLLSILGLLESAESFYETAASDPLLSAFASEWRGWRLRSCDLWWALVTAVCQQNASFRQGWGMLAKLVALYGRRVELEDRGWVPLPPAPRDVLAEPEKLRKAGLGYRSATVLGIAGAIESGELPSSEDLASELVEQAETQLRKIKGVGSYTARLALALALRRYELPPIDRWVKALAAKAYGVEEKAVEGEWRKRWGRWSALAVIALTVALDAAPLSKAIARFESGRLLPESGAGGPAELWRLQLGGFAKPF
jgi:N-glycosylase/DNA lyase